MESFFENNKYCGSNKKIVFAGAIYSKIGVF